MAVPAAAVTFDGHGAVAVDPLGRSSALVAVLDGRSMQRVIAVPQKLSASYPATPETVGRVRRALVDYARTAGMSGQGLWAVGLAVSEAVTNSVVHAYREEPGKVHVTATVIDGELWVLIADDGCGFQTPPATPGLGWGLALITDASEEFTLVERAEGATEARMRFRISSAPSDAGQLRGSVASAS